MKKVLRILLPILLAVIILGCAVWYLFSYDRGFTRDMLLSCARITEANGGHALATWFYDAAYNFSEDNESVAIELAEQYKRSGNYTKAEYTLSNAIADGAGIDVYIALCKTYVEQDKLLDAVNMLNNVANADIKAKLDELRPAAPTTATDPGFYSQYISVAIQADLGTLYVSNDGEYPSIEDDAYTAPISLTDGENSIYAISVGDNGLVSPLAVFGYTVGGVIKEMEFADPVIEDAVRTALNVEAEKLLYTNDLWTITEFTVPEEAERYDDLRHMVFLTSLSITNGTDAGLSCLEAMTNLTSLSILNTTVSADDLATIAELPHLTTLTLQKCHLTTTAPLAGSTALTYLDLSGNTISDVSALADMSQLEELYLQNNVIGSIAPLAGLHTLKKLDVSSNMLTTIAPLSGLAALTWLNASTNAITELGSIGNLTELTYLSLASNKITDVSAVAKCTKLTELNIATNSITDISALSALVNVMYLDFGYNAVTAIPAFPKDCALVTITGTKNKIKTLDPLSGLENLNNVNMDYNTEISSVKSLAKCHNLIEVNVYATKVKEVTDLTNQSIIVNYNPVS